MLVILLWRKAKRGQLIFQVSKLGVEEIFLLVEVVKHTVSRSYLMRWRSSSIIFVLSNALLVPIRLRYV